MSGPVSVKAKAFWPTLILLYAADFITKRLVESYLAPAYVPHRIVGDFLRFTLAYNKNAAMGLSLGGYSREGFAITAGCILLVLGILYRRLPADAHLSAFALALIAAGALGNLTDRVTSSMGVVDFIDVGIGSARFWTFNIADMGVTCGAVLLAIISTKGSNKKGVG
jgi:signal peptidase II